MTRYFPLLSCRLVLSLLLFPLIAAAQGPPSNTQSPASANGTLPGTTSESIREDVSLSSGGLHVYLPITTLTGKGGQSFTLAYVYDSHSYAFRQTVDPSTGVVQAGWQNTAFPGNGTGFNLNIPTLTADRAFVTSYTNTNNGLTINFYCTTNWKFTDETGTSHSFATPSTVGISRDCGPIQPGYPTIGYNTTKADTNDGSFYNLDVTNANAIVVTSKSGTQYHFPAFNTSPPNADDQYWYYASVSTIVDPNGNTITFQSGTITDSVGHVITLTNGPSWKDSNGNTQTVTFPAITTSYRPPNWPPSTNYWTFNAPVGCQFNNQHQSQQQPIFNGVTQYYGGWGSSSIQLPGGATYQFFLDQLGELLAIVYPGGGYTQYDWQTPGTNMNTGSVTCLIDYREVIAKHVCSSSSSSCSNPANYIYAPSSSLSGGNTSTDETDPLGNRTHYDFYPIVNGYTAPHEYQRFVYSGQSTLLKTVQTSWTQSGDLGMPSTVTTTLNDVSPSLSSKTVSSYDSFNRLTELDEYDYDGTFKRKTAYQWASFATHILDRIQTKTITDPSSGQQSVTSNTYDSVGNPQTRSLSGTGVSALTTQYQHNSYGDITLITDPKSNQTRYGYANPWIDTNCAQGVDSSGKPSSVTNALNQATTYKYYSCTGLLASISDPNGAITTFSYDALGRVTGTTNPDGGQVSTTYVDTVPQSVSTTETITSSINKVSTQWLDGLGHVRKTELTSDPDGPTYTAIAYDPMERKYQVWNPTRCDPDTNPNSCTGETTFGITTYQYDALGRVTQVAGPDGTVPTTGSTCLTNNTCSSYSGNKVTVTDQAGNKRTNQTDALGRLTTVWEDPTGLNYETDYKYDGLGNLTGVTQKGGAAQASWRTRSFTYDGLSRLTQSTNPESGTVNYSYLNSSGGLCSADPSAVCQKTAPMPNQTGSSTVQTIYSYDALNRITQKSYSDATATIQYGYDGTALSGCPIVTPPTITDSNPIGYRTSMCDNSGATSWAHDQMGRILKDKHDIRALGVDYVEPVVYTYNLDGSLATLTYPGQCTLSGNTCTGAPGRTLTYTAGGAGRPRAAQDIADNINYVQNATYAPFGGLAGITQGTVPVITSNTYNNRLQPATLSATVSGSQVFSLTYDFHLNTGNNGNIFQITNNRDSTRSTTFQYDALNRIQQANTVTLSSQHCWGEIYTIDAWANLTNISAPTNMPGCNTEGLSQIVYPNNQFNGNGISYDAAGNLTANGGTIYTYDEENRLIGAAGVLYSYDGDGKRMKKSGSNGTLYWTGMSDAAVSETDLSGNIQHEYIFFNGERVARYDPQLSAYRYYFSDYLGSASVITNASGTIKNESDYYPYGGEMVITSGDTNTYKFTGKERDSETGLDDFGARYFTSSFGRFMTPDWSARPTTVPYAVFGDPQSLNLYGYVRNDPVSAADADGHQGLMNGTSGFLDHGTMGCDPSNLDDCSPEEREQAQQAQSQQAAQQGAQNQSGKQADAGNQSQTQTSTSTASGNSKHGLKDDIREVLEDIEGWIWVDANTWQSLSDKLTPHCQSADCSVGVVFPVGLGSTGRTAPLNLTEQLAMEEVMSNPQGKQIPITMNDARWPASAGWVKMTQTVNGVEIHYLENTMTGEFDDFKFK